MEAGKRKELLGQLNDGTTAEKSKSLDGIYRDTVDHPQRLVELVEDGLAHSLSVIVAAKSTEQPEWVALRPSALKIVQLISVNTTFIPDDTLRVTLDLMVGPLLTLLSPGNGDKPLEEDLLALVAGAVRNFVLTPEGAVRAMLLGGVRILLELLHHRNPKVIEHAIAGVANMSLTDTVRNLVGQQLRERQNDIKFLINLCKTKELPVAFFATSSLCFLLLSEQNQSILIGLRALIQIRVFCDRDPLEEGSNFTFSRDTVKRFCSLMSSPIPEVVCFFNWFVARFSSTNAMVNSNEAELNLFWRGHLLSVLRHFARHPNHRTRSLAKISLNQIVDQDFIQMSTVENWLKTFEQIDASTAKKLLKSDFEDIDMDLLLDPDLSKEDMAQLLNVKSAGLKHRLILSLQRYRKHLSEAEQTIKSKAVALSGTADLVAAKENPEPVESSEESKPHGKSDVFISYSWFNKPAARKIKDFLESKNLRCWMDENMLDGGNQLFEEIDAGVTNAKVIVACVSNNYATSENCRREVRLAADRGKIVVPVIVGETKPWPPRGEMGPLLAGKLYVDMSTEDKFSTSSAQLVRALQRTI